MKNYLVQFVFVQFQVKVQKLEMYYSIYTYAPQQPLTQCLVCLKRQLHALLVLSSRDHAFMKAFKHFWQVGGEGSCQLKMSALADSLMPECPLISSDTFRGLLSMLLPGKNITLCSFSRVSISDGSVVRKQDARIVTDLSLP